MGLIGGEKKYGMPNQPLGNDVRDKDQNEIYDLTIDHLNALERIPRIEEIHKSIFKGYVEERTLTSILAKRRVGELDLMDCLVCIGYVWKEWLS